MSLTGIYRVAVREWHLMINSRKSRVIILWVPLVVFTLLAGIYAAGVLRDIPVAVLDQDHSKLSRTMISFIDASPEMTVTSHLTSEAQLHDYFLNHPEKAVFCIPRGMEHDVLKGKNTKVNVLTNSTNIVYGNILKRSAYRLIETVSGGAFVKKMVSQGLTPEQAKRLALPVEVKTHSLFNPQYNYLYYLVPGLLTVMLQMIVFFMGTRSINKELRDGRWQGLMETANNSMANIVWGKLLVYTAIGMVITLFISIIFNAFAIPYQHNVGNIILLFLFFVLANASLGMALSAMVREEIVALDLALFYNSPAFIFSGFTFPIMGMPFFDQVWAQFIPYTHFLHAFFKLYQMGTPLALVQHELWMLTAFIAVGLVTTLVAMRLDKATIASSKLTLTES